MAKTKEKKQFTYSLNSNAEDDTMFVNGNTKKLSQMNQADLATLHKNSDPRVQRKPLKEPALPALPETV